LLTSTTTVVTIMFAECNIITSNTNNRAGVKLIEYTSDNGDASLYILKLTIASTAAHTHVVSLSDDS
jgi:hypothetical protein